MKWPHNIFLVPAAAAAVYTQIAFRSVLTGNILGCAQELCAERSHTIISTHRSRDRISHTNVRSMMQECVLGVCAAK